MTELKAPDFEFICDFIRREAAIILEPGKEYLAENRLHPVAKKAGLDDVAALVDQLRLGDRELQGAVVDALTTNETSFFRDGHPWETLRDELIPELLEKRQQSRTINVWFVASSSGQEPYTFAIMLHEHFKDALSSYRFRLIGTDISPTMIERSRAGKYSQLEVNRGLPAQLLLRHFERQGLSFVARPELRSMFEFDLLNLADPAGWGWLPSFDLVFIRNVLIYFDLETKRSILANVRRQMAGDGVMFLGTAETTIKLSEEFTHSQVGQSTCYRPN